MRFIDEQQLKVGENEIIAKLWNVGAKYPHTITIELGIVPERETLKSQIKILKRAINNQTYAILQQMKRINVKK